MNQPRAVASERVASRPPSPRARIFTITLGLVIVVTTIGFIQLGNWQLRRLEEKLILIERVNARAFGLPIAAPGEEVWSKVTRDSHEYQHISVTGHFLYSKETLVTASTELGSGYWVLTPMRTADGTINMINRGFVPEEFRDRFRGQEDDNHTEIVVSGLLRMSEPDGIWLRSNVPDEERWYSRNLEAIAKIRDLKRLAPFFIDAGLSSNSSEWPRAGLTRVQFRNTHLIYALTWYGLALALIIMTGRALWLESKRRGNRELFRSF
ncbi:MAG: SURF1 family protein [Pseudomonadota bacterium]